MDKKANPFGIYDFLGYLIPGAIFIYSLLILNDYIITKNLSIEHIKDYLNFESAGLYIPFVLASYVMGHLLSYLSSISIEKYSLWKYSYPSKYLLKMKHDGFWGAQKKKTQKVWRVFIVFFILPIFIFDLTIGSIFKLKRIYTRELDDLLIDLINQKRTELIKKTGSDIEKYENIQDFDFYRIILHYTFEHSKQHQSRLQNYVALYGFARTICIIHILIIWFIVFHFGFHPGQFTWSIVLIVLGLSFSSYIFFMNFMKFYRRYTLEGYMVLLTLEGNKQ